MKTNRVARLALVAAISLGVTLAASLSGHAEDSTSQADLVVTVHAKGSDSVPPLQRSDIAVKVKNRPADIVDWAPLRGSKNPLQLVFLFDESSHSYLSLQIASLTKFIKSLPPSAAVGIAYMGNGRAIMAGPMTTDHAKAASYLRLTSGIPGISGSPYFCLSDLAKHWPSKEASVRRVVFMVTNGQDPYYQSRDTQSPYVTTAIEDSQKAGLSVYSIYFADRGFGSRNSFRIVIGQSYLLQVADATGAETYSIGLTSPVSFDPFLQQFRQSLENQYLLTVGTTGSGWQQVSVKSKIAGVKLVAPKAIYVGGK